MEGGGGGGGGIHILDHRIFLVSMCVEVAEIGNMEHMRILFKNYH